MFTKSNSIPYYLQIAQILRERIVSGQYQVDSQIPTEKELVETHEVSRMTARNAITQLVSEGLVYRMHGVGAFVSRSKLSRDLNHLTGFHEDMNELGLNPSSKILRMEKRLPNQREQNLLHIHKNQEVFYINRVRYINDDPIGLQSLAVPIHLVPDIEQFDFVNSSFYAYLDQINMSLERAEQRMEAVMAPNICEDLGLSKKLPFFYFERISYTKNKEGIELLDSYFRGDMYSYNITLYR